MEVSDIKRLIENGIPEADVEVAGEGCNARVRVVSPAFEGKNKLAQQRMVYACLGEKIASGEIHALSIKSFTPEQWQAFPDKQNVI
ncbi:MAG: BolA/IbaG family iron-sulfur metabolism protein [Gammaproteobacteria bacterium]|nr:BolA/IbaG family iron-sulfur metabolism protein [Gammaproteobacteria bacterium]